MSSTSPPSTATKRPASPEEESASKRAREDLKVEPTSAKSTTEENGVAGGEVRENGNANGHESGTGSSVEVKKEGGKMEDVTMEA